MMDYRTLSPFGVSIDKIQIPSQEQLKEVRDLLWEHGIVVIAANSVQSDPLQPNGQAEARKLSAAFNGFLACKPEKCHASANFHSDTSWRVSPSSVSVICVDEMPTNGTGEIWFQSATAMADRLGDDLRQQMVSISFRHNSPTKDSSATHPSIIKHPVTTRPVLYINEAFCDNSPDLPQEESDALLKKIFERAYLEEETLKYTCNVGDIIIYDTLAVQKMCKGDATELKVTMLSNPKLLLTRYVETIDVDFANSEVERILNCKDNSGAYDDHAHLYEANIRTTGYRAPRVASDILVSFLEKSREEGNIDEALALDVAAGTGINSLLTMDKEWLSWHAMDYADKMLEEARRRNLCKEYMVLDANQLWEDIESDVYDGIICTGGFAPNQVNAKPAIPEMVRVTRSGGFVVFTFRDKYQQYFDAIDDEVKAGRVEIVHKEGFQGIANNPMFIHMVFSLKVL